MGSIRSLRLFFLFLALGVVSFPLFSMGNQEVEIDENLGAELEAGNGFSFWNMVVDDLHVFAEGSNDEESRGVKILLKENHITVHPNGVIDTRLRWVYQIIDKKGVENWAKTSSQWSPWFQEKPKIRVRVSKPTGEEFFLNEDELVEGAAQSYSEQIYSDSMVLSGPIPQVSVGAIIEEESFISGKKPFFAAGEVLKFLWAGGSPIFQRRVIIRVMEGATCKIDTNQMEKVEFEKVGGDGFVDWIFFEKNCKKASPVEGNIAPQSDFAPSISIGTGESWAAVVDLYLQHIEKVVEGVDFTKEVEGLIGATEKETIYNIVTHLNERIRYTGIELGDNALIPFSPMETLARGWGDCKDKSVLLVEFLSAAKIPSYPALVLSDLARDVNPKLPGLGGFNHCIVFVDGEEPLWIDPTLDFSVPGTLGTSTQGHYALIIRKGNGGLVETSRGRAAENKIKESIEYLLEDLGYGNSVVNKKYVGGISSDFRYLFSNFPEEDLGKMFKGQIEEDFLFGELVDLDYTRVGDLRVPFEYSYNADKVARIYSGFNYTEVALMQNQIIRDLPDYFLLSPRDDEKRLEPFYFTQPFSFERTYKVQIPEGFLVESMPKSQRIMIGPLEVQQKVLRQKNVIIVKFSYAIGDEPLSPKDALYLKRNASQFYGEMEALLIRFTHEGQKLLDEGDYKGALNRFKEYASTGDSSIHHIRYAQAALSSRLGMLAREEIEKAVKLDPDSDLAWYVRGLIYSENEIGRSFQPGFDWEIAVNSFKKAIELNPNDVDYYLKLVAILCLNSKGQGFASDSKIEEAIPYLEKLFELDNEQGTLEAKNRLLLIYWFLKDDEGLNRLLENYSFDSPTEEIFQAMLLLLLEGEEAMDGYLDENFSKKEQVQTRYQIAAYLELRRDYKIAASVLAKNLDSGEGGIDLEVKVKSLASREVFEDQFAQGDRPEDFVGEFFHQIFKSDGETFGNLKPLLSGSLFKQLLDEDETSNLAIFYDIFVTNQQNTMNLQELALDTLYQGIVFRVESVGEKFYQVYVDLNDAGYRGGITFWLSKEDGGFKIQALSSNFAGMGEFLYGCYLEARRSKDEEEIDAIETVLGWMYRALSPAQMENSDPFVGWNFIKWMDYQKEVDGEWLEAILIAFAMETGSPTIGFEKMEQWAQSKENKIATLASFSLLGAYFDLSDRENAFLYGKKLHEQFPESRSLALRYIGGGLISNNQEEIKGYLDELIAKTFDIRQLESYLYLYYSYTMDYEGYEAVLTQLENQGLATAAHYNLLAWISIFKEEGVKDRDLLYARKAVTLSESKNSAILHTLATLYAIAGKCNEAVKLLDQLEELSPTGRYQTSDWFLYGLIAQQYGSEETAEAAFGKIGPVEDLLEIPTSCWNFLRLFQNKP